MYLKSLELQGFKSFPDKVKLDFNKGLTAVVGPNGSGKSNIGDAVRWVLGEQSTKTLRGNKMEDVIFSGTQFRKSVGFATVTLNIDNSMGILQIPAEEVSVTRKLYRSGESEYLINGSQVRLKDVCELFMDTGLGRDGYSIIGQGRVAEIVSAKSNERREIFEEAAGISKLRYRKAEAERRLTAADDNILRLKDILNELEARVEPLRIQSEKASKFIDLSDKKKALEVSVWIKKLDELRAAIKSVEEKILINSTEYEGLENDAERLDEEIRNSYKAMQDGNVSVEQLQDKIIETERKTGQINSDVAVYENDITHCVELINSIVMQQQNAALSSIELRNRILEQDNRAEELEKEANETAKELETLQEELASLAAQADKFDEEYEKYSAAINKLYINQSEYSFTVSSSETSIEETAKQLDENETMTADATEALEKLAEERTGLNEGLEAAEDVIAEMNNKLSGYARLFESKTKKLSESKEILQQSLMKQNEITHKVQLLKDLENNMDGFNQSVKKIVTAGKNRQISGILGTVAQILRVDGKYSVAIETALGAALQNVVVENEETAKRCIRLLKETNSGRATFLPLTSVKGNTLHENGLEAQNGFISVASGLVSCDARYSGVIASLLGRIVVAEDIDTATVISKKYGYKFRIVTLDGQVINAGGSFTGGSVSKSAGMLTRKNEIEELSAELEKLNTKVTELRSETGKLQAETDKLGFDIEGIKEQASLANEDKIRFEGEKKRIDGLISQGNEQLERLEESKKTLKKKSEELNNKKNEAQRLLEECKKQISEQENNASTRQDEKETMHRRREELSKSISQMKLREVELRKDKENTVLGADHLRSSALDLRNSAIELETQIAAQSDLINERHALIDSKKAELIAAAEEVKSIKAQILEVQTQNRKFEQKAGELQNELKALNESREKYSAEKARLDARKDSIQKEYDEIISDMWEQYEMARSDAEKIAAPIENLMTAMKDLNEIKNKIRALGTVNLEAIEEYTEVSKRYKFMSEQLSDVELSKKELERIIDELTEDMKRRFSESFEEINNSFKQIFSELFGGGKAELVLVNPDDVLESGIEINVAPPGKVIKSLSLLSGGEQAFVAIAIYFAILKLKPAPFCILDEIEAALDDVNVTKYAQYLRNFTKTTQFILITHRRGTMDEADMLYGVTMQEKGISKLLKMSHDEINAMASDT